MADARHFCPDCGGIDLIIKRKMIRISSEDENSGTADCPNCGWQGPLSKTVGAVSSEQFWDIERISGVLVRVVAKHAAAPFIQVMEFVGLLPRKRTYVDVETKTAGALGDLPSAAEVNKHNVLVDQMREEVVKAMLQGALTAGFETAERCHRVFAVKMNVPLHPMLREESADKPIDRGEFGGEKN